ncbi:MAG: aminomethyl-transferring glycine dehydrogenase subunit GcvPB [Clostridiales bacterium]|jgi:glycine dehydrogenase subunit 2|nr:aminomethyl-transferring glycine dehydrogenase subunit GcvPB [Clostridiales bacterium]
MKKRNYHQARWDEPLIMELGSEGERGVFLPETEEIIKDLDPADLLPEGLKRKKPPKLPEISQMQLLRHYLRLSQETIGADLNIDIGLGTCTMKYSPKVHEEIVRSSKMQQIHPYQDESTVQGILEILYQTGEYLKEISGMDAFCLHPAGGSQAIFSNILIMKAFHKYKDKKEVKDEVITTILSHPGNPGAAATAGYKVLTLGPDQDGYPDLAQLKRIVSKRTAGLLITNPEDTGIYNPKIKEIVDIIHSVGGLCIYDQANLNGLFGIARAREAGFDMCHYNLHKSFSSPHGSQGPACGAQGVSGELAKFLPIPVISSDGEKYYFDYDRPYSIGKIRKFYGNPAVAVRTYAYIRSLGASGLKQVAELSILNNNYLLHKLKKVKGLSLPIAPQTKRIEQSRLSWEGLHKDTGVATDDINRRIVDYGVQSYFASHHPRVFPEPFTPEPVETYSKADIDEYVQIVKSISEEAYNDPEFVKTAPHNAALASQVVLEHLTDINLLATTWRAFRKQK